MRRRLRRTCRVAFAGVVICTICTLPQAAGIATAPATAATTATAADTATADQRAGAWSAPEPQVRAYAAVGGSPGDGDPGADEVHVTVTGAQACRWPKAKPPAPDEAGTGVRVSVNGTVSWPVPRTGEVPYFGPGADILRPAADDLLIVLWSSAIPGDGPFRLLVECTAPGGAWTKVVDRSVTPPRFAGLLPVLSSSTATGGTVDVSDIRALYSQPPLIRAEDLTARVDGRAARVEPGERAGLMAVRIPPGTGPGVHDLVLTAGSRTRTVPIVNGFAPASAASRSVPATRRARPTTQGPQPPPDRPRSAVLDSVPVWQDLPKDPEPVAVSLGVAMVLVLLIGFPAGPFNQTLDAHEEEIRRGARRLLRRSPEPRPIRRRVPPALAFVAFCVAGAMLGVLVDVNVTGLGARAFVLFAGFLVAIVVTTLVHAGGGEFYARLLSGERGTIVVLGWALGIAVICAGVSRTAGFEPGYVYGLVAGFALVRADGHRTGRTMPATHAGASALAGAGALLLVGLIAYVASGTVHPAARAADAALWLRLLDSALVTTFVVAVQGVVFGLLPLKFLEGRKLFDWSKPVWGVVYGSGLFVFVYVLMLKHADAAGRVRNYGQDLARGFAIFVLFGLVSFVLWGYFRFRPVPAGVGGGRDGARRGWRRFALGVATPSALVVAASAAAVTWSPIFEPAASTGVPVPSAAASPSAGPVAVPSAASGGSSGTPVPGGSESAPPPDPLRCAKGAKRVTDHRGRSFGTWVCRTERAGALHRRPDPDSERTGYLREPENWFVCQRDGAAGETWLYSQGDDVYADDGWGWYPATRVSSTWWRRPVPDIPACGFR